MEIEDYCVNKAESVDLYHLQSLQRNWTGHILEHVLI